MFRQTTQMNCITEFTREELETKLTIIGFKRYRARQIFTWIYKHLIDFSELEKINIPIGLKQYLKGNFTVHNINVHSVLKSKDKTIKLVFKLEDNAFIETVLIPQRWKDQDVFTICISTQAGCPVRCVFCASGKNGLLRNLTVSEIVGQILCAMKITKSNSISKRPIQNIVIMGMGEPLINVENVIKSLEIIHHPEGINIGWNKITLSTVGIKGRLERLIEEQITPNLALSLHAPNEKLRKKLIPFQGTYPIDEFLNDGLKYKNITKKDVTVEYVLLDNMNNEPDYAKELSLLLRNYPFKVNLIPYNPVDGFNCTTPHHQKTLAFENILRKNNIMATVRTNMGGDINSACGQLALKSAMVNNNTTK